jgi:hypothetical protein
MKVYMVVGHDYDGYRAVLSVWSTEVRAKEAEQVEVIADKKREYKNYGYYEIEEHEVLE